MNSRIILDLLLFINCLLLICASPYQASSNDIDALIIVSKQGEKGVEISYPSDPYLNNEKIWSNGLDRLTQKGKSDCLDLGKALNEKYGKYFKRKADDLATILDDRPSSAEFIQYTLLGLFGSAPLTVIGQFSGHKEMLNGPEDCRVLNRKIRKILRSSEIKQLFKQNKELIMRVTESNRNNPRLIKNVPVVYESIQTELNNNLKQPDWLNDIAINKLKNITISLDNAFYSNDLILQLQAGALLKKIRVNLIDNALKLPNPTVTQTKLAYHYVVGSDQFSALLSALNFYEQRPKFGSSIVIELSSQSNVKISFYDTATKEFIEKQFTCDQQQDVQCKLVPFLKSLDRLIPISKRSCTLPKSRTINDKLKPDYNDILNPNSDDEDHGSVDVRPL